MEKSSDNIVAYYFNEVFVLKKWLSLFNCFLSSTIKLTILRSERGTTKNKSELVKYSFISYYLGLSGVIFLNMGVGKISHFPIFMLVSLR